MSVNSKDIDLESIVNSSLKGKRFGVFNEFLNDSLYSNAINKIEKLGGIIIKFNPPQINFRWF